MVILVHVAIALASLISLTVALVAPTSGRLRASYALVAATIATGTYLVILQPAALHQVCLTGLAYVAVASAGIAGARFRLTRLQAA